MKKIFYAVIISLGLLFLIAISSYFSIRRSIDNPFLPNDSSEVSFVIKQGDGVQVVAENLESEKLIKGSDYFEIYVWQNKLGNKLQAGSYELSPSMTIAEMVNLFVGGERGAVKSNEVQVSIPEGYSNREILDKLEKTGAFSISSDFDNSALDFSKYDFLEKQTGEDFLQGYLFPDTYNFYRNSSLEQIVSKMLNNFDAKISDDLRQEIIRQNKDLYEILILASIVEKEAANNEEMPEIASVFYNRLEIGQMLQSDATVNYVVGEGRAQATAEDLEIDSPFNTYKYAGLPPAPICNPGLDAIRAVIYPAETDYYYFLTTQDEERKTIFSKTYEEHLQNKYKYLN
jgi:UPF0755 protein